MDEYISREEAIKELREVYENEYPTASGDFDEYASHDVPNVLRNMKAADVQPVRHGWWIPQGDDMWLCSNCKKNIIYSMHESDRTEKQQYCCRCGARMDGDTE